MISIKIEWSVPKLSKLQPPQNRRSHSKSVLARCHGFGIHEKSMRTTLYKRKLRVDPLSTAPIERRWCGSAAYYTEHTVAYGCLGTACRLISYAFSINSEFMEFNQYLLIVGVGIYSVVAGIPIIWVLIIQSLYWSFMYFLLIICITDHSIYFTGNSIYFTDRLNRSLY